MAKRNPLKLWQRNCMKCGNSVNTSYSPDNSTDNDDVKVYNKDDKSKGEDKDENVVEAEVVEEEKKDDEQK